MIERIFGGLEAGGTKFVCLVGSGPGQILDEIRFPTRDPVATLDRTVAFFANHARRTPLMALGVGSFGPLDLDPTSPTYGFITSTPKPGWGKVDLNGILRTGLQLPVALDTDVNAAALGERTWGCDTQLLDPFVYVTVGTGIGVGVLVNGMPLHGLVHPEGGHMRIPHDRQQDPFPGSCPFHGDCLEGLASGNSLEARWQRKPEALPEDHPAWDLEARYLALAVVNLICVYSPRRIVLGGGVLEHPGLLHQVRMKVLKLLNGYVRSPQITARIESYLVPPSLGSRSGVLGAIALAIELSRSS
jgi:fructokinase